MVGTHLSLPEVGAELGGMSPPWRRGLGSQALTAFSSILGSGIWEVLTGWLVFFIDIPPGSWDNDIVYTGVIDIPRSTKGGSNGTVL